MTSAPKVIDYQGRANREPFADWINCLRDPSTRRRILKQLLCLEQSTITTLRRLAAVCVNCASFLVRLPVYFAEVGNTLVVLLYGHDKDSQRRGIQQAQTYW